MAVEALRDALKTAPGAEVRSLIFGATAALYLEKLNARSLARRRNCRPTPPSSIRSNASGVSGGITNCPTSVHAASSNWAIRRAAPCAGCAAVRRWSAPSGVRRKSHD